MAELLLTVPEAALRLRLSPLTVQRQLRRGVLRGIKRGKAWRVPESALMESSEAVAVAASAPPPVDNSADTPAMRAQIIRDEMKSGDVKRRNAAIVALYHADVDTREIVFEAATQAVADWEGEEENWSDWRALDGEPFHFSEEEETL